MKKTLLSLFLLLGGASTLFSFSSAGAQNIDSVNTGSGSISTVSGEKRMFTITGYYSPLPGQNFYITGSYDSELRLNGNGIAGADGTAVYPGMIAAPYSYPFGTIICLPNFGCGKVHDRGGAIVEKGGTDIARHDRIDIWTGYGDEGLRRALSIGLKHIEGEIFPPNSPVPVKMNFSAAPQLDQLIDMPERPIFDTDLKIGDTGEKVKKLEDALRELGFYALESSGIFTTELKASLAQFQIRNFIIENEQSEFAGVFGPKTRAKLMVALYKAQIEGKIREVWSKFHFDKELVKGLRNSDIAKLQELLVRLEFLDILPTGYFGPATEEALIQFQIAKGIIRSKKDALAGKVGPLTLEKLNQEIVNFQKNSEKDKEEFLAYDKTFQTLRILAGKDSPSSLLAKK